MADCCSVDTSDNKEAAQLIQIELASSSSHACCAPATSREVIHCPACSTGGKTVDTQIVKAMLSVSLLAVRDGVYYFCDSPDCDVVYFHEDGDQTFTEADLRERVYQKHPDDPDVPVCYCFGYTQGEIRVDSTIADTITHGTKTGQCACDIRNPQGSCCLGNVRNIMKSEKENQANA